MQCPVCKEDQIIVEYAGVELDMCLDGHGIWFDADELAQLADQAGAPELFDDLEKGMQDETSGADIAKRRCPRCRVRMVQFQASAHPEPVTIDRCPRGDGLWFDEGELQSILQNRVETDKDQLDPNLERAIDSLREFLGQFTNPPDSASKENKTC